MASASRSTTGEIVGLIGPNGAGKTTLINLITGVHPATRGRVQFEDATSRAHARIRSRGSGLARTFQIVQPFPKMTVVENVAAGALFCRRSPDAARGAAAGARASRLHVGLADIADQPAASLTLARRKRLELAKSLAMRPQLLMLDEVNAGLNPAEIDDALPSSARSPSTGVTIIVIEHLMKVVLSISHRLVVLHHGQLDRATARRSDVVRDQRVIEAYLGKRYVAGRAAGRTRIERRADICSYAACRPAMATCRCSGTSSLEVAAGELVCIIGSNGAGKTTLMRCLSGLFRPAAGQHRRRRQADDAGRRRRRLRARRHRPCAGRPPAVLGA